MASNAAKANYFGLISIFFKDIGLTTKFMAKEGLFFLMEIIIQGN